MCKKSLLNSFEVFSFFFLSLVFIISCSSPKQQPSGTSASSYEIIFDTIEKARIDTLVESIHKEIRENMGPAQKIPYTLYTPTDSIGFWILHNEKGARITLQLNMPDGAVNWPTFYVYDGELIFVRYRESVQDSTTLNGLETMIYLLNNKIVYCQEHGAKIEAGYSPGVIRRLPFTKSTRSPDEITSDYHKYWLLVLDQMKQNKVLPEFLE